MILGSAASAVGMLMLPIAFTMTGANGLLTPHVFVVALVVASFNALFSVPVELICRWALRDPVVLR